jgi:polysaccharide chain length determinant protein (PEP-CTERM system associated)
MKEPRDAALRPEAVLAIWHRRKWIASLVFLAVVGASFTIAASLPDIYQASATALVERQEVSENVVRPAVTAELETRIQTIQQRVMSRDRLATVITRMNLYPELRGLVPMDLIVNRMRRDIIPLQLKGVDQATGRVMTVAFSLGYRGRDPQTVARVANTLVGFYVEDNSTTRERQAQRTVDFLAAQLADAKRELDERDRVTSTFTLNHTDELPEQIEANLAALDRLNTQLRLNGEYQLRALERRERLETQLTEDAAPSPSPSPSAAVLPKPEEDLAALKRKLAELRRRYSDQYPDVRRLTGEITAMEAQMATEPVDEPERDTVKPGAIRQGLSAIDEELVSLRQQDGVLRGAIAAYEARVANAPRRSFELQQMSRGYDLLKQRYETLLKQYEDAQLAAKLEQDRETERFRILDPAVPPVSPVAPNRLWLVIMGLVAACGLAVGAVMAAQLVRLSARGAM